MYTDAVARISIRQLAAAYPPREWAALDAVRVELEGQVAVVKLTRLPDARGYGGLRRWLVCPGCAAPVQTIALAGERWGCRRCLRWRSRRRRVEAALSDTHEPLPLAAAVRACRDTPSHYAGDNKNISA